MCILFYFLFFIIIRTRCVCSVARNTKESCACVLADGSNNNSRAAHLFGRGGTSSAGGRRGARPRRVFDFTRRDVSHSRIYPLHQQANRLGRQPVAPFSQQPPPSPKIANIYVRLLGVFRASLSPTKYYYRFDRPNAEIIGYAKFWRYRFPNRVYIVCTRQ